MESFLKPPVESKELTVGNLEEISKKLKLGLLEQAVLFGLTAGMPAENIAKELGYTGSYISLIRKSLQKKIEKLFLRWKTS